MDMAKTKKAHMMNSATYATPERQSETQAVNQMANELLATPRSVQYEFDS